MKDACHSPINEVFDMKAKKNSNDLLVPDKNEQNKKRKWD